MADPSAHHGHDQVFFGATVTCAGPDGSEHTVTIKGIDESDSLSGEVSWISPIARALLRAREGDEVTLMTPGGAQRIEVLEVRYPAPGADTDVTALMRVTRTTAGLRRTTRNTSARC